MMMTILNMIMMIVIMRMLMMLVMTMILMMIVMMLKFTFLLQYMEGGGCPLARHSSRTLDPLRTVMLPFRGCRLWIFGGTANNIIIIMVMMIMMIMMVIMMMVVMAEGSSDNVALC